MYDKRYQVTLCFSIICFIDFSDSDHPLSHLLKTYQYHVGQRACHVANMFASQKETNFFFDSKDNGCTFSTEEKSQSISQSPGCVVDVAESTPKSSGNRNNESFSTKTASDQAISSLVAEVQSYLENLETMFVVTYEEFDDEEVRNIVRDLVEDYFFQPVWPHILTLFRLASFPLLRDFCRFLSSYSIIDSKRCKLG